MGSRCATGAQPVQPLLLLPCKVHSVMRRVSASDSDKLLELARCSANDKGDRGNTGVGRTQGMYSMLLLLIKVHFTFAIQLVVANELAGSCFYLRQFMHRAESVPKAL